MTQKRNRRRVHRAITWKEGNKARVADLFIRSLLHHRPHGQSSEQFMESIFAVGRRHLFFVRATEAFALGGRMVHVGDRLLVRHDTGDNFYDISTLMDGDFANEVSKAEFRAISRRLRYDDAKCDAVPPAVLMGVSK